MKIRILCVGKIKEKFYREAVKEFQKRLQSFCNLEIIEVKDEKVSPSVTEDLVISRESEKLMSKMRDGYFIALEPNGKMLDSEELSKKLESLINTSQTPINFIIGGSLGLSKEILNKCQLVLSFSPLTFPHQLFRVMLLEQIYRSFKIMNNQTYHK